MSTNYRPTFPLAVVLFLIFLVLKLCHVITWSWWWVTAPLWIPWIILGGLMIVIGLLSSLPRRK